MRTIKELQAYAAARGIFVEVTKLKKEEHKKVVLEVKRNKGK